MCMHAGTEGLGTQCVPAFESSEMMARAATGDGERADGVPALQTDGARPVTATTGTEEAEIAAILPALPDEPSDAAMEYIRTDDCIEEIGANLLIWERVPMIRETVPLKQTMAAMEDVIFFVRKYRRPERSWLTLDINMSGSRPTEAALHGWYNEGTPQEPGDPWKRPKRKIPKRGRDFVDRWKKEILEPWWEATHSAGKADGGKKKRKAG